MQEDNGQGLTMELPRAQTPAGPELGQLQPLNGEVRDVWCNSTACQGLQPMLSVMSSRSDAAGCAKSMACQSWGASG